MTMRVDLDKLRLTLLPHCLRSGALLDALLRSMYEPLRSVYKAFKRYEAEETAEREYGSTVKQLRRAIADHLGIGEDLVIFGEVADRDVLPLYKETDGKPIAISSTAQALWSDDMVWWNREFTVSLPTTYSTYEEQVRAILERWKMAASRYTIIYR